MLTKEDYIKARGLEHIDLAFLKKWCLEEERDFKVFQYIIRQPFLVDSFISGLINYLDNKYKVTKIFKVDNVDGQQQLTLMKII